MEVIRIFNGLGNQMSQYAFYLSKKKQQANTYWIYLERSFYKTNQHNGFELDNVFGIKRGRLKEFILKRIWAYSQTTDFRKTLLSPFVKNIYENMNYDFDSKMLKPTLGFGFFFTGGGHSEKYFKNIREDLLDTFNFDISKLNDCSIKWSSIISNNVHSCSIHIRRGDYLSDSVFSGIASLDYYNKAIEYIRKIDRFCSFYVFSDDISWCKEHLKTDNLNFIDCNKRNESWQDMYLISICHNHINANSTFSWRGAWLCRFPDSITIVPAQFMNNRTTKDVYPSHWIKI